MAVANRSIIVRSFTEVWEDGRFDDATPSTTTKPGMLVAQYDGGLTTGEDAVALPKYRLNSDVNYPPCIIVEDDLQGKTIDDTIAVGDYIRVKFLQVGEKYVVYGQPSTAIAVGTLLVPHTDGKVIATSDGTVGDTALTLFRAETAVANTDTDTRLVVRVLRV
jgi:hypothetical protein